MAELRQEGLDVRDAKVGDADPLAAVCDECNFTEYDELIVSTLPLKMSKWLHVDLPRKARAATGLPVQHVVASEAKAVPIAVRCAMDLEEHSLDPVIERTCAECGVQLTDQEIQARWTPTGASSAPSTPTEQVSVDDERTDAAPWLGGLAAQQRHALDVRRLREHVHRA